MFSGCLQDFSRIFSECSNGSCGPGGVWWSFQMKVWTLMIQRNSMILTIPWSQIFHDPQLFNDQLEVWTNPKVYCDTSITDGLVFILCKIAYLHGEGRVALTSPSFVYLFFVPPRRHFPTPANCFPSKCSPEKGNFLLPLHFVFFSVPLQIFSFFILSKVVC